MCPILSDLQEQVRTQSGANHSEKPNRKQRNKQPTSAEKPLSKNAYRKQQRKRVGKTETPPTASIPEKVITERKHRCRAKQGAPRVAVVAPTPTLGSYLPSVQVLCAISLVIGIILLIRNK